ncbi:MAG: M28 family peptidase [Actinobacteria bacterium]|nr:M28 family peptidase [Actinomycetota bacterium]
MARDPGHTRALLALIMLLAGCGGSGEKGAERVGNTSSAATQPVGEAPTTDPEVQNVARDAAASVDEASIQSSLDYLTGVSPAPLSGGEVTIAERGSEEGRGSAARYMKESFEAVSVPARVIEFDLVDSVFNAGASDDASGLVSLLETAKALKQIKPEYTVHFVAYDLEEIGLYGSSRYVESVVSDVRKREGEEAIIGDINSDMVGYDEGRFKAVMGSCNRAGPLDDAVLQALKAIDSPLNLKDDCLARSDHQNFWDAGYPALILTDGTKYDAYPWYHKSGDTVDKLNIPYLQSMIQLTAASAALLASPGK